MKRFWQVWVPFLVCLAVLLTAMGWISLTVLRLDRAEAEAQRRAALEENVRLALWRMDSALAPLVAQEGARPYFAYGTFLPVDRAYGRMFQRGKADEILMPSPLLGQASRQILVHFQFESDGQLVSPQRPTGNNYRLAVPKYLTEESVRQAGEQLDRVRALVDWKRLIAMLPTTASTAVETIASPLAQTAEQRLADRRRRADLQSQGRGAVEFERRSQAVLQNTNVMAQSQNVGLAPDASLASTDVGGVTMTPLWISGQLVLARRITAGGREYVQGCLLDWPAIKTWLLETVEDLLPEADLEPVVANAPEKEAWMLAALPARLVCGPPAPDDGDGLSPIRLSLLAAWGCVLLAATAVAVLVWGVVGLSERRAAFVSAVTHELRTPLTTFHMYTEMLADGMVPDPDQQRSYLNTLQTEAARLSHLVENVLLYARLERGRGHGTMQEITLGQLIEPMVGRLADRVRQAGMELVVEGDERSSSATVRANPSAVEQILFNLVDNACKYAAAASDKRVHLGTCCVGSRVQVRVRDHGPGVAQSVSRRLFRVFSKSAREAANSAPGVGLGLALSRRLARAMGARLQLDDRVGDGACFVLTLAGKR